MNNKLKVGCSPLTGKIFAGKTIKQGLLWAEGKQDVTDQAVRAVAANLVITDEKLQFSMHGKKYELKVVELIETTEKP